MSILLGPFDPIQLNFSLINHLLNSGILTSSQAREILRSALTPEMSEEEKEKFLDSLFRQNPHRHGTK